MEKNGTKILIHTIHQNIGQSIVIKIFSVFFQTYKRLLYFQRKKENDFRLFAFKNIENKYISKNLSTAKLIKDLEKRKMK